MLARTLICAAALIAAVPAAAQVPNPDPAPEAPTDRGYDVDTPKHDAINAQEAPVTRALNNTVDQATAARDSTNAAAQAQNQAQYDADMAAYRAEVTANHREAARDSRRYNHQQRAYADAMAQWRMQTDLCNRGKLKACKLPTPNPADYY